MVSVSEGEMSDKRLPWTRILLAAMGISGWSISAAVSMARLVDCDEGWRLAEYA